MLIVILTLNWCDFVSEPLKLPKIRRKLMGLLLFRVRVFDFRHYTLHDPPTWRLTALTLKIKLTTPKTKCTLN